MRPAPRTRLIGLALLAASGFAVPSRAQGPAPDPQDDAPSFRHPPRPVSAAAARTWLKLYRPIAMPFEAEAPLQDVIRFIKQATADGAHPAGLPIFVEPAGLAATGATMASPVTLNVEGVPLATSLKLMLDQLGLSFRVQGDGIVVIGAKPRVSLDGGPISEPAARAWLRLQQVVDIPFGAETPLEDVVRFVKDATRTKEPGDAGLSIYVDPIGLQEHERTMASTLVLKLEGFPLATTLDLMLRQLDLVYFVRRDGLLFITSKDSSDYEILFDDPEERSVEFDALKLEVARLRAEVAILKVRATVAVPMTVRIAPHGPPTPPPAAGGPP